nr:MAG TPA: hypothetical protein [Caudoviricetes sp.]
MIYILEKVRLLCHLHHQNKPALWCGFFLLLPLFYPSIIY